MDDLLRINDELSIPLSEIELRASRSSGPGGQHANVTASRIEAVFDVRASPTLSGPQRDRLLERSVSASPPSPRTPAARRATASSRWSGWPRSSPRRCTSRSADGRRGRGAAAKERRLEGKKRQSKRKAERRRPALD